jgi:putative endonuclease
MAAHNDLGKEGEVEACNYLRKNGFQIVTTNYRFDKAEVDIIARKDDVLVAVEVKTRSTKDFGLPQDFLKPQQIKRLVKAVNHYVEIKDLDVEVRFDVIAVISQNNKKEIEHLEDAFLHF